jgi:hypothetical protein
VAEEPAGVQQQEEQQEEPPQEGPEQYEDKQQQGEDEEGPEGAAAAEVARPKEDDGVAEAEGGDEAPGWLGVNARAATLLARARSAAARGLSVAVNGRPGAPAAPPSPTAPGAPPGPPASASLSSAASDSPPASDHPEIEPDLESDFGSRAPSIVSEAPTYAHSEASASARARSARKFPSRFMWGVGAQEGRTW